MLNRRHLRVKVLQALYAYHQSDSKDTRQHEKNLLQSVEKVYEMCVTEIKDNKIYAKVERGGHLSSKKGINVPETKLSGGGLTKKDEQDAYL